MQCLPVIVLVQHVRTVRPVALMGSCPDADGRTIHHRPMAENSLCLKWDIYLLYFKNIVYICIEYRRWQTVANCCHSNVAIHSMCDLATSGGGGDGWSD